MTSSESISPGVAGALFGGVITAPPVLGRNLMSAVTRPWPTRRFAG